MRHGEADNKSPDMARELTVMGCEDVLAVARQLAEDGVQLQQIWHSPFTRAVQTAEHVRTILGADVVCKPHEHFEPGDSPELAAADIEAFFCANENADLLIASHMPLLPGLVAELTGCASVGFNTATCIALTRSDVLKWSVETVWEAS